MLVHCEVRCSPGWAATVQTVQTLADVTPNELGVTKCNHSVTRIRVLNPHFLWQCPLRQRPPSSRVVWASAMGSLLSKASVVPTALHESCFRSWGLDQVRALNDQMKCLHEEGVFVVDRSAFSTAFSVSGAPDADTLWDLTKQLVRHTCVGVVCGGPSDRVLGIRCCSTLIDEARCFC